MMQEFLVRTSHRLRPLPIGRWKMTQRWNDLLFVHWPVPVTAIAHLLPAGLQVDTYQGSAWVGVIPFWLDRVKFSNGVRLPTASGIPALNLRTLVRDEKTKTPGTYVFSLDNSDLMTVLLGRGLYHLPYHWADMCFEQKSERDFTLSSRRRFARHPVQFQVRYRGLGPSRKLAEARAGSFESFLMDRNCLFSCNRQRELLRSNLHHIAWPLEDAEALIERNDLASAAGISLPRQEPVLHYMRRLAVYIWPAERIRPAIASRPVRIAVTPSG
jgi:uncharacterized protein